MEEKGVENVSTFEKYFTSTMKRKRRAIDSFLTGDQPGKAQKQPDEPEPKKQKPPASVSQTSLISSFFANKRGRSLSMRRKSRRRRRRECGSRRRSRFRRRTRIRRRRAGPRRKCYCKKRRRRRRRRSIPCPNIPARRRRSTRSFCPNRRRRRTRSRICTCR